MRKRREQIHRREAAPLSPATDKENSGISILSGIKHPLSKDLFMCSKQGIHETIPVSPKNLSLDFSAEASPIIGRSRVAHGVKTGFHSNLGVGLGSKQTDISKSCVLASLHERKNFQNVLQPRKLPLPKPIATRSSPRFGVQSSALREVNQLPCLNSTPLLTRRQCKDKIDKSNSEGESIKSSSEGESSELSVNETVVHAGRKSARLSQKDSRISSHEDLTCTTGTLPEAKGSSYSSDHVEHSFVLPKRVVTGNRKETDLVLKKNTIRRPQADLVKREISRKRPQKKMGGENDGSKQADQLENLHNLKPKTEGPSCVVNRSKLRKQVTLDAEEREEIQSVKVGENSILTGQRKYNQRDKGNSSKTSSLKQTASEVRENKVDSTNSVESQPKSSKTARKRKCGTLDTTKEIVVKRPKIVGSVRAKSSHSPSKLLHSRMENKKVLQSEDQKESLLTSIKPKLPIWYSTARKQTPVAGKRKSKRLSVLNVDVFEFSFNPEEEGAQKTKKARKRKPAARKPRPRPKVKSTYMITDPSWQQEIKSSLSGSSLLSTKLETKEQDYNVSSVDDNYISDHDIPDCGDTDEVMQEMEFETCSAFINTVSSTDSGPLFSLPTSISACPTPALPKNLSKFAGSTSTPRLDESRLSRKGHSILESRLNKPVEEEIKKCFGFCEDDSEDEVDELDISPVRRSHTHSSFETTGFSGFSDKFESSLGAQPTRFSWGSLRPGQRSNLSVTRSLSMVNHGRSSVSSMSASHMSGTTMHGKSNGSGISLSRASSLLKHGRGNDSAGSFSKPLLGNINTQGRRNKTGVKDEMNMVKGKENKDQKNAVVEESGNLSLLFDEEPVETEEGTSWGKQVQNEEKNVAEENTNHVDKVVIVLSPQKTLIKAPRRSYDRQALELSRRKFLEQHGVSALDDLKTGADVVEGKTKQASSEKAKQTKSSSQKVKKKKLTKKKQKSSEDLDESSQSLNLEKGKPKRQKRSKKAKQFEKSFQEWCSDLNNHFSEIEDLELIVQ